MRKTSALRLSDKRNQPAQTHVLKDVVAQYAKASLSIAETD
jgi:hypothetical protein